MLEQNDSFLLLSQAILSLPCHINLPEAGKDAHGNGSGGSSAHSDKRRFARKKSSFDLAMKYQKSFPVLNRPIMWHRIRTTNISKNGLGFYHFEQMFPKEHVIILLQDGTAYQIEVARCRRIRDNCFVIGAKLTSQDTFPQSVLSY